MSPEQVAIEDQHERVFLSQRRQCAAAPCLEPQAPYKRGVRKWQKYCWYHSTNAGWREWQRNEAMSDG